MAQNKRRKRDQQTYRDDISLWRSIFECKDPDHILYILIETSSDYIIQRPYRNGDYLLHVACRHRRLDAVVMKLLELFPIATAYNNDNNSYPLHIACSSNMPEHVLIKLLELYPDAASIRYENEARNFNGGYFINGGYMLHEACRNVESVSFIRQLVKVYPRALEETNVVGYYPIHCALEFNQSTPIIQLLIDADPLAMERKKGDPKLGDSTLHVASRSCTSIMPSGSYTSIQILEYMVEHCNDELINIRNSKGRTPLHEACILGLADTVETLLQHPGILINATDNCNETPLHKLFRRLEDYSLKQVLAVTRILLSHPYIVIDHKSYNYETPLDLLKERIDGLKHLDSIDDYDNDDRIIQRGKDYLSQYRASLILLEEFVVQKRWHSYQYFFENV